MTNYDVEQYNDNLKNLHYMVQILELGGHTEYPA